VYNEDLEPDVPSEVMDFKKTISDADGIIMVTPEYNFSYAITGRSRAELVFLAD
jgi:chromate reductase